MAAALLRECYDGFWLFWLPDTLRLSIMSLKIFQILGNEANSTDAYSLMKWVEHVHWSTVTAVNWLRGTARTRPCSSGMADASGDLI